MVSFFFFNQGGEAPFYRESETSLPCLLPMWDYQLQMKESQASKFGVYNMLI